MANAAITAFTQGNITGNAQTWGVAFPAGEQGQEQHMFLAFKSKAAQITALPTGVSQVARVDSTSGAGSSVLLKRTLAATITSLQGVNIVFNQGVEGAWCSNTHIGFANAPIVTNKGFATTTIMEPVTSAANGSLVVSYRGTASSPKNGGPQNGLIEHSDQSSGNGPSACQGSIAAASGVTITPTWTAPDFYGVTANSGDAFTGFTVLIPPATDAPSNTGTVSGGGVIPIVGIQTVQSSGAASIFAGANSVYTATVNGTDGLPFEGVSVSATVVGGLTLSASSGITDSSGNATFTATGVLVGQSVITFSVGSKSAVSNVNVQAVTVYPADKVVLVSSLPSAQAGQSVSISVVATYGLNDTPSPTRQGTITYTLPGGSSQTQSFTTNAQGRFTITVTPLQSGMITAGATVDSINSAPMVIDVIAGQAITAEPSEMLLQYPGPGKKVTILRGTAAQAGLDVQVGNADVIGASLTTGFDGSVTVTPIAVGVTELRISYTDAATGAQSLLVIPVTVEVAGSDFVIGLFPKYTIPALINGDPPIEIEFIDQNGLSIPDENSDRMKFRIGRPERIAISNTSDNGKILIYGTGAGDTILYVTYQDPVNKLVKAEFPITVLP